MASIEQTRVQKIKKEAAQNLAQVRFNESLRHGINTAATLYTLTSTTTQDMKLENLETLKTGDTIYSFVNNNFYVYNGATWALDTSTRFKRSGVLFTGPNEKGIDSLYQ